MSTGITHSPVAFRLACLFLLTALFIVPPPAAGTASAQSAPPEPYLVRDINPLPRSSSPHDLVNWNGTLFFFAAADPYFPALWASDGTGAGTVLIKQFQYIDYGIRGLMEMNGALYFMTTSNSVNGLWKTDGTEAGTILVKDLGGYYPSIQTHPTLVGDKLFFACTGAGNRIHFYLCISDGTEAGTYPVVELGSTPESNDYPSDLTSSGSALFFVFSDDRGRELWKSDSTTASTFMVKDIAEDASSNPGFLTDVGGTLFFAAEEVSHGRELWKSNGTEAGTILVKDLFPGPGSADPSNLINFNGTLFFTIGSSQGFELWKSDGTEAGTVMVKTLGTEASPGNPALFDGRLFFSLGPELWASDGTGPGTGLVKDLRAEGVAEGLADLTPAGGSLFFTAGSDITGRELWSSDGTEAGTLLVKDIYPGANSSNSQEFTDVNGMLFFAADDGATGLELWKSDGTREGTQLVRDLVPGTRDSNPAAPVLSGGSLFFYAEDGIHDRELWKTDGEQGAVLVKDIYPGSQGSTPEYYGQCSQCTVAGDLLFFVANDGAHGPELWRSDGTESGTFLVKDIILGNEVFIPGISSISIGGLTEVSGKLFFFVFGGWGEGLQLWKSDGTEAGTIQVKEFESVGTYELHETLGVNGTMYFSAVSNPEAGFWRRELWKSDGTEVGTQLLFERWSDSMSGHPNNFINFIKGNGLLFFNYFGGLWKSDGTPAGTIMVKDGISPTGDQIFINGFLFFTASDNIHGYELWRSDGTEAGTQLVQDIYPGPGSSSPGGFTKLNGTFLFFTEFGGRVNPVLWSSDGTSAGTQQVKDMRPFSNYVLEYTDQNGVMFFTTANSTSGYDLWRSDGIGSGTILLKQGIQGTGERGCFGICLRAAGGELFFVTEGGDHGNELWALDTQRLYVPLYLPFVPR